MVMVSPLHRAIDAVRWDRERLLGRLIVLVHAAFLDAGFVPLPHDPRARRPCSVPKQAGRTSSTLSLRYGVPQLLHRHDPKAAALRILAHVRRHLILCVRCDPWPVERCVVVDTLAAAPLLAGGLDATARALRRDRSAAALWRRLSDDLCRRALVDICRQSGVALEPAFASLPDDAMTAVLARLASGADLARAELVCAALRRLVAGRDRELWKPRNDALAAPWLLPDDDSCCCSRSPETSWKERYVAATRWKPPASQSSQLGIPGEAVLFRGSYMYYFVPPPVPYRPRCPIDWDVESEVEADPVADRRNRTAVGRGKRGAGRGWSPPPCVQENRRRGAGAVHAPSSRYRWKHR
ncbi:unnamed protein product [Urochloa humidicola]